MNVLSLFDGMRCGYMALERAGIPVTNYYASEVDKYAMQAARVVYPDAIELGDVNNWREWDIDWSSIDLVIAGSPCQGFSFAGKQLAFDDPRSKLFFVFVDILNYLKSINPGIKFMLENVRMKKEFIQVITDYMGVKAYQINSNLVSAQNRYRLYWTNIEGITQPEDRGILLKDIVHERADLPSLSDKEIGYMLKGNAKWGQAGDCRFNNYLMYPEDKSFTVTANIHKGVPYNCFFQEIGEHVLLQGPPDSIDIPEATVKGFTPVEIGDGVDTTFINSKTRRGRLMKDKSNCLTATPCDYGILEDLKEYIVPFDKTLQILDKEVEKGKVGYFRKDSQANRVYYIHDKAVTLCGDAGGGAAKMGQYLFGCITPDRVNKRQNGQRFSEGRKFYTLTAQDKHGILIEGYIRKLTPIECGRLQTVPDAVIFAVLEVVSQTQCYKILGNGWTIDVIAHIFKNLKQENIMNDSIKDFKADTAEFENKGDSPKEIGERLLERKDKIVKNTDAIVQNGITLPTRTSTIGYKVWQIASHLAGVHQRPPLVTELLAVTQIQGIKDETAKTNYRKWRKFYGADEVVKVNKKPPEIKEDIVNEPERIVVDEVINEEKVAEEVEAIEPAVEFNFPEAVTGVKPTVAEDALERAQEGMEETASTIAEAGADVGHVLPAGGSGAPMPPVKPPKEENPIAIDFSATLNRQLNAMLASGAINVHITETLESVSDTLMKFIDENSQLISDYHATKSK